MHAQVVLHSMIVESFLSITYSHASITCSSLFFRKRFCFSYICSLILLEIDKITK